MVTGADIRRYRRAIGQTQVQFARRLGVTQAAVSLIEQGRTAVSDEHIAAFIERFAGPEDRPPFTAFLRQLDRERSSEQAAIQSPGARHLTLTVWNWDEGLDLSRVLPPDQAVGLVTIRSTDQPAIAFAMPKETDHWRPGEILVFEECGVEDLRGGDICLVHVRPPRSHTPRTMVALAHLAPAKRGRALQFEPLSPPGPFFTLDAERLLGLFHVIFRGRYCK